MALPLEERIRNLEQEVKSLSGQIYYAHPTEMTTFFGLVKRVAVGRKKTGDDTSPCKGYLEVQPLPAQNPADVNGSGDGSLTFVGDDQHPLSTGGYRQSIRVYSTVAPSWLPVLYNVGDIIKYFHYDGSGLVSDQADIVRGSYVTVHEEPWEFYGEIWPGDATGISLPTYKFYPMVWINADDSERAGFRYAYNCDKCCVDGDRLGAFRCKDLAWESDLEDLGGFTAPHPPIVTPFVTKITRMIHPATNPNDMNFTYFFDSTNTDCRTASQTTLNHADGFQEWQSVLSPSGTGVTLTVVSAVTWDGTSLKQYTRDMVYNKCGQLVGVGSEQVSTIDTPITCVCP